MSAGPPRAAPITAGTPPPSPGGLARSHYGRGTFPRRSGVTAPGAGPGQSGGLHPAGDPGLGLGGTIRSRRPSPAAQSAARRHRGRRAPARPWRPGGGGHGRVAGVRASRGSPPRLPGAHPGLASTSAGPRGLLGARPLRRSASGQWLARHQRDPEVRRCILITVLAIGTLVGRGRRVAPPTPRACHAARVPTPT